MARPPRSGAVLEAVRTVPRLTGAVRGRGGDAADAADPRLGYQFAALNALISGFAIFINSIGVRAFADSTLYTTLKNGVVGAAVVLPLLFSAAHRRELAGLGRREWGLLALIALVAGSVAYALDFRGLQISTAATAAVIDHSQFLLVAVLAAVLLGERPGRAVVCALAVLAGGLALGLRLGAVHMDAGVPFLVASTVLFALGALLIKAALRTISVAVVVAMKMTVGSALLLAYTAATGRLGAALHLSPVQWAFALVTGGILLAFTLTELWGLRHASATGVMAISAGAPIVTTLFVAATRHAPIRPAQLLGLGMILAAVLTIYAVGSSREARVAARLRNRVFAG
ncbi:MAG TPA: DMT family transporter [bacterium]|nr:DMT family transporter [bacterium]